MSELTPNNLLPEIDSQTGDFVAGAEPSAQEWATFDTYCRELEISPELLRGKEILDLGGGLANFAKVMQKFGIKITTVDAHPEWHEDEGRPSAETPYVVGDALNLPFKDSSFDLVIARAAVHSIVKTNDQILPLWREVLRVLKPGGEFRFGPGSPISLNSLSEEDKNKWWQYREKYDSDALTREEADDWNKINTRFLANEEINQPLIRQLEAVRDKSERAKIIRDYSYRWLQNIYPNVEVFDTNSQKTPYGDYSFRMWKPKPKTDESQ